MRVMSDEPVLFRVPVQWTILGGWLLVAVGVVIWSAVSVARSPCDGFGCDPALTALVVAVLVAPPIVVSAIFVALISWLVGRRMAIWSAWLAPPVLTLVFSSVGMGTWRW